MAKRSALNLSSEAREELTRISQSRTEAMAKVLRSKILLLYSEGKRITDITREIGSSRPLIERCIDKALAFGPM
ncbi:MAG TPA: IS630 family transposase, partial [Geobacteraceae bacterium]|nr:IS630 family transposase [Geobacteraceae bacterium]